MSLAVCLDCRESSYFHTTILCVFSNIISGFILLHFNCDSEVPAEGTGYTSNVYKVSYMKANKHIELTKGEGLARKLNEGTMSLLVRALGYSVLFYNINPIHFLILFILP